MRIALVGDVHGCVYHCLAALVSLHRDQALDAIVQIGDLGAWPDQARMFEADPVSVWFSEDNGAQLDWFDLVDSASAFGSDIRHARDVLGQPIWFIRGNHDDPDWLRSLETRSTTAPSDPFDVYHFVADGTVTTLGEVTVAFLGGIECDPSWPQAAREANAMHAFDDEAVEHLGRLDPGSVDLLITHDGPYGVATNWRGLVQGAPTLTKLEEHLQPRWHVAGHYHHQIGPEQRGAGTYLGLSCLVGPLKSRHGSEDFDPTGAVQPASIAVLDTQTGRFEFPDEAMVRSLDRSLDFSRFMAAHGARD